MNRLMLLLLAAGLLVGVAGCRTLGHRTPGHCMQGSCVNCPTNCQGCATGAGCGIGRRGAEAFTPGPPVGAITYPYYTTRGPRDFLASNPRSIGP